MNDNKVELSWLLQQIAAIQDGTEYLKDGLAQLAQMGEGDSGESYSPGNILGKAKADALGGMIRGGETTTPQPLGLYETLSADLWARGPAQ